MASIIKNIEYIKKHFDVHSDFIIKKLNQDTISLSGKSSEYVSKIVYPIVNYIDFVNDGVIDGLELLSVNDITNLYEKWFSETLIKFNTKNYIETNKILIDYRNNNVGFYWVDLESYYSSDMIFRMENCGRVNSYQTFLELREYDNLMHNNSRVFIVLNNNGYINQIRGVKNMKPDKKYYSYIFDLCINYDKILGFDILFGPKNDLTLFDFSKEQLDIIKNIKPHFFKKSLI